MKLFGLKRKGRNELSRKLVGAAAASFGAMSVVNAADLYMQISGVVARYGLADSFALYPANMALLAAQTAFTLLFGLAMVAIGYKIAKK